MSTILHLHRARHQQHVMDDRQDYDEFGDLPVCEVVSKATSRLAWIFAVSFVGACICIAVEALA